VLLLVDLQQDYLSTGNLQPAAASLVSRAAALVRAWRARGLPVVHVWTTIRREDDQRLPHWKAENRWMCVDGTEGHRPPELLRARPGEAIVHKSGFDGFKGGTLDGTLRAADTTSVVVAGVHLHACVREVVTGCLDRGLDVVVAQDAVGSNSPIHAAATKRWLLERCVRFEPSSDILAALDGVEAAALPHYSPRQSDVVLFHVALSGREEIDRAARTAREASQPWRHVAADERRQVLLRFATCVEEAAPELARLMAIDIGKPLSHGVEEVRRAVDNIRDVVRRACATPPRVGRAHVREQPVGVVAVISPWNNPVAIPAGKIAPALVYGNTLVWKPAPAATRIAQMLLRLLVAAGVPAEAVPLVSGGRIAAQRLAGAPGIDAVTFTGSLPAGYDVQEICAARSVPLQAELGGNNAAIVWEDCDVQAAARELAWGAFGFAGQRCTANRRIVVHSRQFDRFWSELLRAAGRLRWNDPVDAGTDIGPVISVAKREEFAQQVDSAQDRGVLHRLERLFDDRRSEPWVAGGAYVQPVAAACDVAEDPIVQDESMAPVVIVQRAADFDQAIALCNAVRQGLAAALFSDSVELQERFIDAVRAGIVKINTSTAGADITLPFGGWKASGIGPPEHGDADRQFYTRMQAVYV
jgi:acyl-CoA reductase-like NAD-dependent aldehyde dehydrogenase/nicotinamidase-related amidase